MKIMKTYLILLSGLLVLTSCTKKLEVTGEAIIAIDNQDLSYPVDIFVEVGIVLDESDNQQLIYFGKNDIRRGGNVEIKSGKLNYGNYYVRYQYYHNESALGTVQHKLFQIQPGETTRIEIIRKG